MFILQKGLSTSIGTKKALHVNSKGTLTVKGNFCSSISRNEHELSFLSTRRDGLHSLTYRHYDEAEARMRRTPRHRHEEQWHDRPNYQIHTCCQYTGQVILVQLEGNRQTLHERRSNLWHPTVFLLDQAMYDVLGRHFLTIASSPRHVFAHARGPRSDVTWADRDPRSGGPNFVHRWRPGAAQKSRSHGNSMLCIQMYAWDPWTRINRLEFLSSIHIFEKQNELRFTTTVLISPSDRRPRRSTNNYYMSSALSLLGAEQRSA